MVSSVRSKKKKYEKPLAKKTVVYLYQKRPAGIDNLLLAVEK